MLDLKIELTNFGIRHFLVRPDDGKIFPTFINLPLELRRRLNSTLNDEAVVAEAIKRYWVIVKLRRTTVLVRGMRQRYVAEVQAARRTFGGKIRSYPRTAELLRYLEQWSGDFLPVRLRIFDFPTGGATPIEIETHLSSSADFAKIFMHTFYNYNRPIDRTEKNYAT